MWDWLLRHVVPSFVVAVVLLLVLWPTQRSGLRLLRTWGIPWPNEPQVAEAVRYLRQRRLLYVALFLVIPPLAGLIWPHGSGVPGVGIFVPLLVALLIAELVATLRPVSGVRVASLVPRSWRDLVPNWAIAMVGLLVAVTIAFAVVTLAGGVSTGWLALGTAATCLVVVAALVRLAVRRPAVADPTADAALRVRTARVAVGIGFGWLGAAVATAAGGFRPLVYDNKITEGWLSNIAELGGPVAQLAGIAAWIFVTTPSRRSLAALPA